MLDLLLYIFLSYVIFRKILYKHHFLNFIHVLNFEVKIKGINNLLESLKMNLIASCLESFPFHWFLLSKGIC